MLFLHIVGGKTVKGVKKKITLQRTPNEQKRYEKNNKHRQNKLIQYGS
jgi:hypothetical protein